MLFMPKLIKVFFLKKKKKKKKKKTKKNEETIVGYAECYKNIDDWEITNNPVHCCCT